MRCAHIERNKWITSNCATFQETWIDFQIYVQVWRVGTMLKSNKNLGKRTLIELMIYLLAKSTHTMLANCTTRKRLVIGTTILTLWAWVILTGQFSWWKIWWIIFTKRTRTLHFIENHCIQQVYCGRLRHWSSGLWLSLEQNSIPNWTKNWASFLVGWRPIQIYNLTIFWCVTISANSNTIS